MTVRASLRPLLLALVAACGAHTRTELGPLRFADHDPVRLVNDRKPTPPPSKYEEGLVQYYVDNDLIDPTRRALTIGSTPAAQNVNSLGEVPDSAWFTNRTVTVEEMARGPGGDGPDRSQPWHVMGVKVGGAAIGITIKDARGDTYVLKFDERGHAETETSADVVVQRLTWAFGYNVPENNVVTFARKDLVLDEKAAIKLMTGASHKMTEADLDMYLGMIESSHGQFRGLASKFITGKILGGVEPIGTRKGDANDKVPHELRRDLRGQRVLWAWVNHIDLKSQNTIATYTDGKFVKWYAIDFGESLGVGARTDHVPRLGYRVTYSVTDFFKSLVTFGIRVAPFERQLHYPDLPGLGYFESKEFEPAEWVPNHSWRPTDVADKFDELWGAEILMRFSREHIAAAVAAGKYSDPRTAMYLVDTLVERQRKLGRYAFSRLAPLTAFSVTAQGAQLSVCFDDLWLKYTYGAPAETSYRARAFDFGGKQLGETAPVASPGARGCVAGVPAATDRNGYTIVKLEVRRGGDTLPPVFVHVAGGKVIGIDRR